MRYFFNLFSLSRPFICSSDIWRPKNNKKSIVRFIIFELSCFPLLFFFIMSENLSLFHYLSYKSFSFVYIYIFHKSRRLFISSFFLAFIRFFFRNFSYSFIRIVIEHTFYQDAFLSCFLPKYDRKPNRRKCG